MRKGLYIFLLEIELSLCSTLQQCSSNDILAQLNIVLNVYFLVRCPLVVKGGLERALVTRQSAKKRVAFRNSIHNISNIQQCLGYGVSEHQVAIVYPHIFLKYQKTKHCLKISLRHNTNLIYFKLQALIGLFTKIDLVQLEIWSLTGKRQAEGKHLVQFYQIFSILCEDRT